MRKTGVIIIALFIVFLAITLTGCGLVIPIPNKIPIPKYPIFIP